MAEHFRAFHPTGIVAAAIDFSGNIADACNWHATDGTNSAADTSPLTTLWPTPPDAEYLANTHDANYDSPNPSFRMTMGDCAVNPALDSATTPWIGYPVKSVRVVAKLAYDAITLGNPLMRVSLYVDGSAIHYQDATLDHLTAGEVDFTLPSQLGIAGGVNIPWTREAFNACAIKIEQRLVDPGNGTYPGWGGTITAGAELRYVYDDTAEEPGDDDEDLYFLEDDMAIRPYPTVVAFNSVTSTPTAVEIDMPEGTKLLVGHEITGSPGTGGYCSVEVGRLNSTSRIGDVEIATLSRSTTTLTVTTRTAHGLAVGDVVRLVGTSVSAWNTELTVASAADTTTFTATVANSGATSGTGGTVRELLFVPHHGDGVNIKSGSSTTSYSSIFKNCGPVCRLTCNIPNSDGVHTVWYQVIQ